MRDAPETAVVTVSYTTQTDRLLRQSAALAGDPAVREWIVVANGNGELVRTAAPGFAVRPRLVMLADNAGSAIGFATGIAAALADPANGYLLLLDEDNLPEADTVTRLLAAFRSERDCEEGRLLAIAGYRDRAHAAQAQGIDIRRPDSSIGFHLSDLPAKLLRRLREPQSASARVSIRTSAYGGLFLDRALIEVIGLPRADFVLYGDDTELTLRMTAAGARVLLDPSIRIADMDVAPAPRRTLFSFVEWLSITDDFRLFYGARNETWLDARRFAVSPLIYRLNRDLVGLILRLYARTPEQRRRLELFRTAAREGETGRLGVSPHYPLPKAQR